ncbi:MAG: hypothetical protein U1D30_14910 [Planctomycetota bacterium]
MGVTGEEFVLLPYQEELANSLERGEGIGPLLRELNPRGRPMPTPQRLKIVSNVYLRIRSKALAAVVRGGVTLAVTTDEIKSNRVPVLALVGEEDPIHEKVRIMTTLMPKVKLVVIPGAQSYDGVRASGVSGRTRAIPCRTFHARRGQTTSPNARMIRE